MCAPYTELLISQEFFVNYKVLFKCEALLWFESRLQLYRLLAGGCGIFQGVRKERPAALGCPQGQAWGAD